jgi:hypothetical protein
MTKMQTVPIAGFTLNERAYIRIELDMIFSTHTTVAEGFLLKAWRGGTALPNRRAPAVNAPVLAQESARGRNAADTGSVRRSVLLDHVLRRTPVTAAPSAAAAGF